VALSAAPLVALAQQAALIPMVMACPMRAMRRMTCCRAMMEKITTGMERVMTVGAVAWYGMQIVRASVHSLDCVEMESSISVIAWNVILARTASTITSEHWVIILGSAENAQP
jgi:hypothetical protein